MLEKKIVRFEKIYKFVSDYFFIRAKSFHLFIKNVFMNIKNFIFLSKYTIYGKNVEEQNSLSQRDLQISC